MDFILYSIGVMIGIAALFIGGISSAKKTSGK